MANPTVSFYPDYRRSNPYQDLLYRARPGRKAVPETLEAAHARLRETGQGLFHLHWTAPFFADIRTEADFKAKAQLLLNGMRAFQADGGKILWTVHNLLPHARQFRDLEIWFRIELAATVDRIHVHDTAAIDQVARLYPLPADRIVVAAHGHMIDAYKKGFLSSLRRPHLTKRALGLTGRAPVAAVIGQLRPNKGIEDFLSAAPDAPVQALLAGRVTPKDASTDLKRRCADLGIAYREGFIPSAAMAQVFGLADIIVLPYREILTSGSLMLALSMAKPVILPDLPSFQSLKGARFADFYTPGAPDTLVAALTRLSGQRDLDTLGQAARTYVSGFTWEETARALFPGF